MIPEPPTVLQVSSESKQDVSALVVENRTITCKSTNITNVRRAKKKVVLKWKKIKYANKYIIQRSIGLKGKFRTVKTLKGNKRIKWTDTNVKKGKSYRYRVQCIRNNKGKEIRSKYSPIKRVGKYKED